MKDRSDPRTPSLRDHCTESHQHCLDFAPTNIGSNRLLEEPVEGSDMAAPSLVHDDISFRYYPVSISSPQQKDEN